MERLPMDVLQLILAHLPFADICVLASVSKQFYQACTDKAVCRRVDLQNRIRVDTRTVRRLLRGAHPTTLLLAGCPNVTDEAIIDIAARAENLTELRCVLCYSAALR
jgi:hypothetical protein